MAGTPRILRVGAVIAIIIVVYFTLLGAAGFIVQGCVADSARARLTAALDAHVTIEETSVSLLRGRVELRGIRAERGAEHLVLAIDQVVVDVPSMGWSIVDRHLDRVAVRGVDLSISARGALTMPDRPKRRPIHLGRFYAEDIHLVAMPTAIVPGLGRIELTIDKAEAGPFALRSALSWLFHLRAFEARADFPGGIRGGVQYDHGTLRLSAGLLGSEVVELPFELPVPDPDALELEQLGVLIKALTKVLAVKLAKPWLQRQITDRLLDLIEPPESTVEPTF